MSESATELDLTTALAIADERTKLLLILTARYGLRPREIALLKPTSASTSPDGRFTLLVPGRRGNVRAIGIQRDLAKQIRGTGGTWLFPGQISGHLSPAYISKLISTALPDGVSARELLVAFSAEPASRSWREAAGYHSPKGGRTAELPFFRDRVVLLRALGRIDAAFDTGDTEATIGNCKELLESVLKLALVLEGETVDARADLQGLFRAFYERPSVLRRTERIDGSRRKLLRTLANVVQTIAELRNVAGTGHGRASTVEVGEADGRLVFNATVALVEFIADDLVPSAVEADSQRETSDLPA